jgi:2-hydroxychromene-2-carboxylate isomerase
MGKIIDYYFSPVSPWTYLGHARLVAMAAKYGATIEPKPIDLGRVFPLSGGLPLAKRAPQRQAYRMAELKRWREFLGIPLNVQPKFFPAPVDEASMLILAAVEVGRDAALNLSGALLRACWAEDRDIADAATLGVIAAEQGLDAAALLAAAPAMQSRFDALTQEAIDRQVFGAPFMFIDEEPFWGQDRLDFVERKLARA